MQHLTSLQIVHRDIKPGNILKHVNQDGSIVYKICDFGAAKVVDGDGEESGSVHGTLEYMVKLYCFLIYKNQMVYN